MYVWYQIQISVSFSMSSKHHQLKWKHSKSFLLSLKTAHYILSIVTPLAIKSFPTLAREKYKKCGKTVEIHQGFVKAEGCTDHFHGGRLSLRENYSNNYYFYHYERCLCCKKTQNLSVCTPIASLLMLHWHCWCCVFCPNSRILQAVYQICSCLTPFLDAEFFTVRFFHCI